MENRFIFRRIAQIVFCLSISTAHAEESLFDKIYNYIFSTGTNTVDPSHGLTAASTFEARAMFKQFCSAEFAYFMNDKTDANGKLLPNQFISAGPTPAVIPKGTVVVSDWSEPGWKELGYYSNKPHRYQYRIEASGTGDQSKFTLTAEGDIEGSGKIIRVTAQGSIHPTGGPQCGDEKIEGF